MNVLVVAIVVVTVSIVAVCLWRGCREARHETFVSPSNTLSYSVCRSKGFSKEHCLTRYVPGKGYTSAGLVGRV
jgi:hypothetical protein